MPETARLTVLTGSQSGTELEVDLSSGEAVIGSDPTCAVHVKDPAVSPRHALIQASGSEILIQSTDYASEVLVNGNAIAWLTPISEGDEITLGTVKMRFGGEAAGEGGGAANPFAAGPAADEGPSFDFGGDAVSEAPPDLGLGETFSEPEAPAEEPEPAAADDPPALKLKQIDEPPKAADEPDEIPSPPPLPKAARAPARPARAAAPRRPAAPAKGRSSRPARRGSVIRNLAIGLVILAALGGGVWFALPMFLPPRLDSVAPARASVGETVVLEGAYFGATVADNSVLFGETPGVVQEASRTRITVEVPAVEMGSSREVPVSVRVRVGERDSAVQSLAVFQAPRVVELKPEAAMPGEEVVIQGSGFGDSAEVRFGDLAAEVLSVDASSIRVRVPALEGNSSAITVQVGELSSAPAPFLVGKLPLISSVQPASAAPGDRVTVSGKGFGTTPAEVLAELGSHPALVVSAARDELVLIAPPVAAGEQELTVRVPPSANVGRTTLRVTAGSDPLGFHFVAEPFTLAGAESRDRAVVRSDLGTAFVVAGVEGKPAAQRAAEVQDRLNGAAQRLAGGAQIELRSPESAPAIGVSGDAQALVEVTDADAAAYNEAWARPSRGGGGPPVTRERLGRWWGAVLGDLARLLARGEAPSEAAALASEGQVLASVHSAAGGRPTRSAAEGRASTREALRTLALRVPAGVPGAAGAAPPVASGAAPTAAAPEELDLTGIWTGYEREAGRRRQVSITFSGSGGEMAYLGASVGFTQPVIEVRRTGNRATWITQRGSGDRHYDGTWDGRGLTGSVSSTAAGGGDIGTFELYPKR